jgi:hypothetical protein
MTAAVTLTTAAAAAAAVAQVTCLPFAGADFNGGCMEGGFKQIFPLVVVVVDVSPMLRQRHPRTPTLILNTSRSLIWTLNPGPNLREIKSECKA